MTKDRTLKQIIEKQREELHIQRVQLNSCETFFDMLWNDEELSKLFRLSLAEIRCKLCDITDCSTRNDSEECLRIIPLNKSNEMKP